MSCSDFGQEPSAGRSITECLPRDGAGGRAINGSRPGKSAKMVHSFVVGFCNCRQVKAATDGFDNLAKRDLLFGDPVVGRGGLYGFSAIRNRVGF